MTGRAFLLNLFLLLFFFASLSFANPEISVRRSSKVESQGTIQLGDIAEINNLDGENQENIKSEISRIEIIELPQNAIRNLTGFQISKILRKHLPALEEKLGEKIKTTVPPIVRIQNQAFKLNVDAVGLKIESDLKKLCSDCEFKFAKLTLPDLNGVGVNGSWSVEYQGSKLPRGNFNIPLRADNKTFWVTGTVKALKSVPVAVRNLSLGERVSEADFKMELRDITLANDGFPERLIGRQIGRAVPANEMITYANLAKEIAVKYGQAVKIVSENEWLQISMNGIAQEKGDIGDRIKVLNPSTKAVLSAVIESSGTVRVQ